LRGHILYPLQAEDGKVLAWIGRDPAFEEKERDFLRLLPEERAKEKPPQKHKVPSGFARGSHLFGQHAARLQEPGYRDFIAEHGIIVVEGFNDVIGLDGIGVPAVGLCSNRMTEEQADKVDRFARLLSNGKVTLLLDCDDHGDEGAKEALWLLAQRRLDVRLGWTQTMHSSFKGRQPESLSRLECDGLLP
jgi:5S rRNA maturation endonuclease (ribonuclease M5)